MLILLPELQKSSASPGFKTASLTAHNQYYKKISFCMLNHKIQLYTICIWVHVTLSSHSS